MKNAGILVSDFDGTMTRFDFYDLVCREFPDIAGGSWQQYERGAITHFEALRLIFAGIHAPEERLHAIIDSMQLAPRLAASVAALKDHGWHVIVASAGCDWYIKRLLAAAGVVVEVHANPGTYTEADGLQMRFSAASSFLSPGFGIDKAAIVRDALTRSSRVAFAGDGRPDLEPALLVHPDRRFAKSWLAGRLREMNEKFRPFEDWAEVAAACIQQERGA